MYETYSNIDRYEPIFLALIDENEQILATLLAVIQREYRNVMSRLTARSIIWGGPLIRNNDDHVFNIVLDEYN